MKTCISYITVKPEESKEYALTTIQKLDQPIAERFGYNRRQKLLEQLRKTASYLTPQK